MAFDFKKEYKEYYMPKNTPEIVTVPKANITSPSEEKATPTKKAGLISRQSVFCMQ